MRPFGRFSLRRQHGWSSIRTSSPSCSAGEIFESAGRKLLPEYLLILITDCADKPEYKAECMYQRFGLLVLISAGCALFASVVAYKVSAGTRREPPTVKTAVVVTAAANITAGTVISEKQLKLTEVPESLVPAGVFRKMEDVKSRSATNT